jgi:endonuclease III
MRYQVKKNVWQEHPFPWAVVDTHLSRVARYTETIKEAEDLARQANAGYWEPRRDI